MPMRKLSRVFVMYKISCSCSSSTTGKSIRVASSWSLLRRILN